jgi:hypothetical protein
MYSKKTRSNVGALAGLQGVKAGTSGCTPIDNPAPRWSAYVFNLKREHNLSIETRHEPHRGDFPGTHGRYVLLSPVEISDAAGLMLSDGPQTQ